ncbi:hypothetical protein B0T21DRAFT_349795 [Apiosordaria backusii]|uniref:AB hydrolase-1 domain-containing protein n=1 Tax=Apiosordaria backusii TaxID=314023 RepID=A0AA40BEK5_9PEZI|nr:hypothetical protein B0T21DRAFT_349795 [Apiosordaria backusii]
MKKTLLLCFIHGFKGNDHTFGPSQSFPTHLLSLLRPSLPKLNLEFLIYPTFETRGDLTDCVNRFRDWLLNKVIDLEVSLGTPSPTVEPGVRVILIGHSMGGIVAAETAISIASEQAINGSISNDGNSPDQGNMKAPLNSLMFPYIQGVLAFDTPYLGISPGVVAHGAETHYSKAAEVMGQLSGLASIWGGASNAAKDQPQHQQRQQPQKALPAPPPDPKQQDQKPGGGWGKWGTLALAAGAVGAITATGAAAYLKREQITQGLSWATSHLEFVGCLARKEELRKRVTYMVRLNKELKVGFGNLYTRLGKSAGALEKVSMVGTVLGDERTFCVVPNRDQAGDWRPAVNDKARDETWAHMSMFEPKDNPGYDKLANDAKDMITSWVNNEWYESSTETIHE